MSEKSRTSRKPSKCRQPVLYIIDDLVLACAESVTSAKVEANSAPSSPASPSVEWPGSGFFGGRLRESSRVGVEIRKGCAPNSAD